MADEKKDGAVLAYYRSVSAVLSEALTELGAAEFAVLMKMLDEEHVQKDAGSVVRKRLLDVVSGDFTPTPDQMKAMVILLTNLEIRR